MFSILKRWNLRPMLLLLSDRRSGKYRRSVPSMAWFDRVGLSVNVGGEEVIYDFDPSVPACNQFPWYLEGVEAIEFDDMTFRHTVLESRRARKPIISEQHHLAFNEGTDVNETLLLFHRGAIAQERRSSWYGLKDEDLTRVMKHLVTQHSLRAVDSMQINNFRCENDLVVTAYGTSAMESRTIDSLVTVPLANHFLREFRDRIASSNRQNDLALPEAFELRMDWFMDLPPDYSFQGELPNRTFGGPQRSKASVMTALENGKLLFRCRLSIGSPDIPRAQFNEFLRFLDEVMSETDRTLVFARPGVASAQE